MNIVPILGVVVTPDVLAAVFVPVGLFSVLMVAILTRHQRQMAEIIHGRRRDDALAAELAEVKGKVAELESQLRALGQGSKSAGASEELAQRLGPPG